MTVTWEDIARGALVEIERTRDKVKAMVDFKASGEPAQAPAPSAEEDVTDWRRLVDKTHTRLMDLATDCFVNNDKLMSARIEEVALPLARALGYTPLVRAAASATEPEQSDVEFKATPEDLNASADERVRNAELAIEASLLATGESSKRAKEWHRIAGHLASVLEALADLSLKQGGGVPMGVTGALVRFHEAQEAAGDFYEEDEPVEEVEEAFESGLKGVTGITPYTTVTMTCTKHGYTNCAECFPHPLIVTASVNTNPPSDPGKTDSASEALWTAASLIDEACVGGTCPNAAKGCCDAAGVDPSNWCWWCMARGWLVKNVPENYPGPSFVESSEDGGGPGAVGEAPKPVSRAVVSDVNQPPGSTPSSVDAGADPLERLRLRLAVCHRVMRDAFHKGHSYGYSEQFLDDLLADLEATDGLAASAGAGVYDEVRIERQHQDAKWGGPDHDDEHGEEEFARWIGERASIIDTTPDGTRENFIEIAALAVAAIESYDRRGSDDGTTKDGE